ncbi:MAG: PASTA domain-containing protein [Terriglobales bacterium]|jgi:eukaryotic-like serine/threonine-protein kinase
MKPQQKLEDPEQLESEQLETEPPPKGTIEKIFRYFLLAMMLLMVATLSALTAMRFAIHGGEVKVPKIVGMTPEAAAALMSDRGLIMDVQDRFYSPEVAEGKIMSQAPAPEAVVRRAYRVRVAVSLGPQRALIPDLIGKSGRTAEISVQRRGLEVGTVAVLHLPDVPPDQVVAQSPAPNANTMTSPKVSLLVSAPADDASYVMPNFVGAHLADASQAISEVGLRIGKIEGLDSIKMDQKPSAGLIIARQSPAPGARVSPGMTVTLAVGP